MSSLLRCAPGVGGGQASTTSRSSLTASSGPGSLWTTTGCYASARGTRRAASVRCSRRCGDAHTSCREAVQPEGAAAVRCVPRAAHSACSTSSFTQLFVEPLQACVCSPLPLQVERSDAARRSANAGSAALKRCRSSRFQPTVLCYEQCGQESAPREFRERPKLLPFGQVWKTLTPPPPPSS